jgi:hypothetical protein
VPAEIWPGVETLIGGIDAALAGDRTHYGGIEAGWQQAVHLSDLICCGR